jgi:hypothetical protein
MKQKKGIKALASIVSLLASFSVFAQEQPDVNGQNASVLPYDGQEIVIQRPELPGEAEIIRLPNEAKSENHYSAKCFAAYRIRKGGPDSVSREKPAIYRIEVENIGNCFIPNVQIADFFPRDARFVNAKPPASVLRDDQAVWLLSGMPVGTSFSIEVALLNKAPIGARVTNTGCVWSPLVGQEACGYVSAIVR